MKVAWRSTKINSWNFHTAWKRSIFFFGKVSARARLQHCEIERDKEIRKYIANNIEDKRSTIKSRAKHTIHSHSPID